jgi:hypothetical protein
MDLHFLADLYARSRLIWAGNDALGFRATDFNLLRWLLTCYGERYASQTFETASCDFEPKSG